MGLGPSRSRRMAARARADAAWDAGLDQQPVDLGPPAVPRGRGTAQHRLPCAARWTMRRGPRTETMRRPPAESGEEARLAVPGHRRRAGPGRGSRRLDLAIGGPRSARPRAPTAGRREPAPEASSPCWTGRRLAGGRLGWGAGLHPAAASLPGVPGPRAPHPASRLARQGRQISHHRAPFRPASTSRPSSSRRRRQMPLDHSLPHLPFRLQQGPVARAGPRRGRPGRHLRRCAPVDDQHPVEPCVSPTSWVMHSRVAAPSTGGAGRAARGDARGRARGTAHRGSPAARRGRSRPRRAAPAAPRRRTPSHPPRRARVCSPSGSVSSRSRRSAASITWPTEERGRRPPRRSAGCRAGHGSRAGRSDRPRRSRGAGVRGGGVEGQPSTRTRPLAGRCQPRRMPTRLDLPAPDGPTMATWAPASMSRSILSRIVAGRRARAPPHDDRDARWWQPGARHGRQRRGSTVLVSSGAPRAPRGGGSHCDGRVLPGQRAPPPARGREVQRPVDEEQHATAVAARVR